MEKRIKISGSSNLESLEKAIKSFQTSNINVDLQIPLSFKAKGFGLPTFALLLLFSWMRHKKGKLVLPVNDNIIGALEDFSKTFYGYLALFTVWRHCEIVNIKGASLKPYLRQFTSTMNTNVMAISTQDLPNNEIALACFDHYSQEKGLPYWFYDADYEFKSSPGGMDDTTHALFSHLAKIFKNRLVPAFAESATTVSNILWELIKNTHEHARTDGLNQVKLLPNTRGVFMKIHRSSRLNFLKDAENRGLSEYYLHFPDSQDLFFLEISVFDSGPGLVKRFLGKSWKDDIAIIEDVDTVKKCLIKGQTSIEGAKGDKKGYGLDSVLKLLSEKRGFLSVRTGRVWLYRDLIATPYIRTQNFNEIQLYDWGTNSDSDYTKFSNTDGTLITLALPLT
jgi:Histidine kinase-, DNA gyrase B-, and HSP90-like ATPase.